jgi:predicted nucleic acid-binding protein
VPKYVFDTRLILSNNYDPYKLPETTCISSVVHYQLMMVCKDVPERTTYELAWRNMQKEGLLVIPTDEDCLAANRISSALIQERLQQTPKLSARVRKEIAIDCLLAVSAARERVIILTLNRHDFADIKRHCENLQVQEYPTV